MDQHHMSAAFFARPEDDSGSIQDEPKHLSDDESSDSVIENSEGVTQDDLATLRHVRDKIPCVSLTFPLLPCTQMTTAGKHLPSLWNYGTAPIQSVVSLLIAVQNLYNNYIRAPLPPESRNGSVAPADCLIGVAGALGRGQEKSFAIRTFNTFFVYVTPFLGAVIADTKWGRYKTICVFTAVIFLGHIILVASATPAVLQKPETSLGLLVLAVFVIAVGAASIKSNFSPLIADQYTGKTRKVSVSPGITIESIYLYFYMAINLGSCGAISASFLACDNGFWVTYLVPTCIFAVVPIVLYGCRKYYVITPPRGSILLETFRVVGVCLLAPGRWSWNPLATWTNLTRLGFWDPAKPSASGDDEFVGEVHRTMEACKVILFFPVYWFCVYSQIDGNLGTVAAGMTLQGTPNDLIQNLDPISIVILIPIFEWVLYPGVRKLGINFSPIKRITAGFLVAALAMVYSSVLEKFLYDRSPCSNHQPSAAERRAAQCAGPYILVAISDIFATITSLEYAYTKAPKRMKSVVMAFSALQTALASALNFALTAVNGEQKFEWLFTSFAISAAIFAGIFYWTFWDLDRRETELNLIGTGKRDGFVGERPGDHPEKAA
ncbi:peptide/h+ symporter protein [Mycena vulgaris]|nr:peptide/h+ symporter protein [Mycena vulgaris]